MAHALHGNVLESQHEIAAEANRLIGPVASRAALARMKQLMRLQLTIDAVRRMSNKMSPDRYMKVMERIEQMLKEIE
jgi:hypothetical protein